MRRCGTTGRRGDSGCDVAAPTLQAYDLARAIGRASRDPARAGGGAVRRVAGTLAGDTWTPTDGGPAVHVDGDQARVVAGVLEVCEDGYGWPTWDRYLAVGRGLVERYTGDAPADVANEAIIRAVGWLIGRMPASTQFEFREGEAHYRVEQAAGHQGALRHSGAAALLSPWRVRRAV